MVSSSELVLLPLEVSGVSQNKKRVLLEELKSTDNVVVSSLLLPSKEFTRVPLIKTKRNPMILSPTIELVSLPMEVSGDSHSSYLGMHALTTIFEEKRVRGPLDHPVLSVSHLLPSEGPEHSLNALERISRGDIPQQPLFTSVESIDMLTVDTPVPTYTVSINKMKIVINGGLKSILRDAAILFNKFASLSIGGVWSSNPIDEQVVRRAELYLEKILRKNDVSNAESVAISAAALFLKENDILLKGLVKTHTDLMENVGLDEAIILFQNDCPFGFNEIKCKSAF